MLPFKCDQAANEKTRKFLNGVISVCLDFVERENDRREKVIDFHQPDEVMRMFDFSIPDSPAELDSLVEDCRRTLALQVKTGECACASCSLPSGRPFVCARPMEVRSCARPSLGSG